jgi:hypothetical protein
VKRRHYIRRIMIYLRFHEVEHSYCSRLGSDVMYSGKFVSFFFWRNILPSSSEYPEREGIMPS